MRKFPVEDHSRIRWSYNGPVQLYSIEQCLVVDGYIHVNRL